MLYCDISGQTEKCLNEIDLILQNVALQLLEDLA